MVIDEEGNRVGEMDIDAALQLAYSKNLDLVEVAPNANPPVCKITDYNKYHYQLLKKLKDQKKNQKIIELKEIKLAPAIETNDLNIKMNAARKFFDGGDKVKFTLEFRERKYRRLLNVDQFGVPHPDMSLLHQVVEKLSDVAVVEKEVGLDGFKVTVVLSPKKKK